MNEDVQRQLVRQLKLLNFWVTFFGVIFIAALVTFGILLFQLIAFMQDTAGKLEAFQQDTRDSLNVKKQICQDSTASRLIGGAICE